ncbi:UDP-N-acetylmuramoyl-L-alanyl-D-glutamate--2,6-diaminopimelate ligase [Derxia gummosa]|uniref:UDP-N-acetylmuramoyl-L-alanyl-D-glutamate--2,6-diaminopimelate ligase n=1 Tax=Derxia gummosa DSM 723 TaxID=1121388 RepID=A0A8B6XAV2_9BURK|nr:UDP-N-acetylmuramoyl-L-alanyl-D-glutamate--2,6-diaminopimelate ligase [Derxia gummosa]
MVIFDPAALDSALATAARWALAHAGAQGRLVSDSRQIRPGDIFVAFPGDHADGRRFLPAAQAAGAAGAIIESRGAETPPAGLPFIAVPELRRHSGELAAQFYGHPNARMQTLAITGTNGKTTSALWLAQALARLGRRAAMVGTLGVGLVSADSAEVQATGFTTPDAVQLQTRLADLRAAGADALAIEATSIGLEQHRLDGLRIDVAVFTNLTHDHLDYHGTFAAYEAAKHALFRWPGLRAAVINLDDPAGERFARVVRERADAVAVKLLRTSCTDASAELFAHGIVARPAGMGFTLRWQGETHAVEIGVPGLYNIHNWLGCTGALLAAGYPVADVLAAMRAVTPAPGRMQMQGGALDADGRGEPLVVVDYAHTPDALEQALVALRPIAQVRGGRLVALFGCGGDRDRRKRPVMAAIGAESADDAWLTSDNPRSEAPEAILAEMAAGVPEGRRVRVEPDRARAIADAVAMLADRDVLLVAGKGHERYQDIAGVKHPFYDPDHVAAALARRAGRGVVSAAAGAAAIGPTDAAGKAVEGGEAAC